MTTSALAVRVGPLSVRIPRRFLIATIALVLLSLGITLVALMAGERWYSPPQVWQSLLGEGTRTAQLFIVEWRLPRALAAVVFGACLGAAGAIFQTITRNPLGSPDIIGFTTGAHTGGILVILFMTSSYAAVFAGALVGGLVTAIVIYLLAYRSGVQGFRLIIVGIGITAMLASLDTYLMLISASDIAMIAATWGAGSLNAVAWEHLTWALLAGVIALLLPLLIARPLAQLPLGDERCAALGATPERTRLLALLVGVVLVAIPTASAGPIAFIALAAPQIGRRLAGSAGTPILPAMVTGACLLGVADVIAQHLTLGLRPPVGVVTVSVGGAYLIWLILRENRRGVL